MVANYGYQSERKTRTCLNSFVLIAKCIKAVSGNTSNGTRKQSVLAGLFVTFMDGCQDMGTIPRT